MAFPEAWMNELLSKNDIVSVISETVQLTPKGSRLWGHCPFHADRSPSFSVSPDKQLFHCFSCKAGGSVIQFIMQSENLSFADAVRRLAQRAGMDMPDEIDDSRLMEQKRRRERIYDANREAALYYNRLLFSSAGTMAQSYLERRGVTAETAKRFGLGYSPEGFDGLFNYLTEKGFSSETLIEAGLASRGRKDPAKAYDFFRGRLMFPVINAMGKVVAFGGRTMGQDEPKYINTGDTPVYNKRENVYAINLLKGKKLEDVIMVEGYMDVISLHQRGIDNAVASLGTALTNQQARLIKRYASKVYYAYDGDEAGQKAMLRGIDILRATEIEPRVIIIPDGRDPDEFIKEFGRDEFLALKDAAITGMAFKLERIAAEHGLDTSDGREKFAREACRLLSGLDPVERDRYIPTVVRKSGLTEQTVREQCGLAKREPQKQERQHAGYVGYRSPKQDTERLKFERKLLACMMTSPEAGLSTAKSKGFSPALFSSEPMRVFASKLISAYRKGGRPDVSLMIAELEAADAEEVSGAYAEADELVSPEKAARDIISRITTVDLKSELTELSAKAAAETDPDAKKALLEKYRTKYAELQALVKGDKNA